MISFWKAFWAMLVKSVGIFSKGLDSADKGMNSLLSLATVTELAAKELEDRAKAELEINRFKLEREVNQASVN